MNIDTIRLRSAVALLCGVLPWQSLHAHHSGAEYTIGDDVTEIEGVVTRVSWGNPHILFTVVVMDKDGKEVPWMLETASAIAMTRRSVPKNLLEPGMTVRVVGHASKRRPSHMSATNVLLPSGLEIVLTPDGADRRLSDRSVGMATDSYSSSGPLPADGRGVFRIWSWEPVAQFWMMLEPENYPLTAGALAAQAQWDQYDPADNPVLRCEPPGLPATMGDPHPIELVERGDTIEIHMEEFDQVRTIHMARTQDPESVPRSPLGYSVGRWEKDSLVVVTTRLNARYFNRHGVPQSEQASVEERFTPDAANGRLNYVLTVTDPINLREPFVQRLVWNWNENAYLQRYDCQVNEE